MRKSSSGSNKGKNYLDVTLNDVRRKGFDSVYAPRGNADKGGVKFDEMIVYDKRLALPRYIVYFDNVRNMPSVPRTLPLGKRHVLKAERNYDPTSQSQFMYRTAES
eukprot:UC1_evm1s1446